jgi:outer membrane protein OmpA-like peptidoglycan-associated protein
MANLETVFGASKGSEDGEHWLTVSDLMAGLMMVFLFIAIAYMRAVTITTDETKKIVAAYEKNQVAILDGLNAEFKDDLTAWGASIDKNTLSFEFNSPEVLFDLGESTLKPEFQNILVDFIPRYLGVLQQFKANINEVRIEGHTSPEWGPDTHPDDAYFFNMALSQNRTRSVLSFAYFKTLLSKRQREWVKTSFAAVGLASSKFGLKNNDNENNEKGRRVSFRVITNADKEISKIISRLLKE